MTGAKRTAAYCWGDEFPIDEFLPISDHEFPNRTQGSIKEPGLSLAPGLAPKTDPHYERLATVVKLVVDENPA
jgi:hypothetical protein